MAIYKQAAREAKRASRVLRKQYLLSELKQAENAYQRGDQRGLFEVMRRLAPKQRKAKGNLGHVRILFGVTPGWSGSTRLESKIADRMSCVLLPSKTREAKW